jgi:hypothetical protein
MAHTRAAILRIEVAITPSALWRIIQHMCCNILHEKKLQSCIFNGLVRFNVWHTTCPCKDMELNTTILREIAFQINQGNPWWGMLLVNEYLDVDDVLRRGLATQFVERIAHQKTAPLAKKLLDGNPLQELPRELRSAVGARTVRPTRPIPAPRTRTENNRRLAIRDRTQTGARRRQSQLQKKLLSNKRTAPLHAVQP